MPDLRIFLDPCNPGQFYACCGLIELFDREGARVLSHFALDERLPRRAEFYVTSQVELDLTKLISYLKSAEVRKLNGPDKAEAIHWGDLELDWWLDEFRQETSELKGWAGKQTSLNLVTELRKLLPADATRLFGALAMTTVRFNLDPRSAWLALDLGYSPNEQRTKESATYPAVELLAAAGLQGFRPCGSRREGFRYHLWLTPLPRVVARTASCRPWPGLPVAAYRFEIERRGQQKCFTLATKEDSSHDGSL